MWDKDVRAARMDENARYMVQSNEADGSGDSAALEINERANAVADQIEVITSELRRLHQENAMLRKLIEDIKNQAYRSLGMLMNKATAKE
jgi:hypothetical protein